LSLRKQQLATEFNRKHVLRYCFGEWQRWHGSEVIKRELALAKEQTRKKMDELLKAASLGKLSSKGSSGIGLVAEAVAVMDPAVGSGEVHCSLCLGFMYIMDLQLSFTLL
jgi:hypothetical protein